MVAMATRSFVFLVLMGTMLHFVTTTSTEKTQSPIPDIQQTSLFVTSTSVVSPITTLVSSFQRETQTLVDSKSTSETTNARPTNHTESSAVMTSAIYSSLNATVQPSSVTTVVESTHSWNHATISEVTPTTTATLNLFNLNSSPTSHIFNISPTVVINDVLNMSGSLRNVSSIYHDQWLSSTLQPSSSFLTKMQTTVVVHSTGRLTLDLSAFSYSSTASADLNVSSRQVPTTSVLGYTSREINTHPSVIVSPTITVLAPAQNGEKAKVGRTDRMTSGAKAAIGIVITLCLLGVIVAGVVVYRKNHLTPRSLRSFLTTGVRYKTYKNATYKEDEAVSHVGLETQPI